MMREFDRVTVEVGRRHAVTVIDMAKDIELDDSDFYDFAHMTPKGAEKVGSFLFRVMRGLF